MTAGKAPTDNSAQSQRAFIRDCLRKRPHSTLELRNMGICSPAPRIMELRARGYEIMTTFATETDHAGRKHNNIAVYELLSEPKEE